jgi:hypothetical protein
VPAQGTRVIDQVPCISLGVPLVPQIASPSTVVSDSAGNAATSRHWGGMRIVSSPPLARTSIPVTG